MPERAPLFGPREVREERTGWRDEKLSEFHRRLGWDCPAVDIDFVLVEYDRAEVCGMVEYKHEYAAACYPMKQSGLLALRKVCTEARKPFFIVRYAKDFSWFKVRPLNRIAIAQLSEWEAVDGSGTVVMTRVEYVVWNYELRGRQVPEGLLERFEHFPI